MIRIVSKVLLFWLLLTTTGCSGYKTGWDCPKETGIGCSSLEYADGMAREQILLNTSKTPKKVLLKHDLLDDSEFEELEITE